MELTIKITNNEIYDALTHLLKALHIEIINEKKDADISEDTEFYNFSAENIERAYSLEEPEYTLNMVKESFV